MTLEEQVTRDINSINDVDRIKMILTYLEFMKRIAGTISDDEFKAVGYSFGLLVSDIENPVLRDAILYGRK